MSKNGKPQVHEAPTLTQTVDTAWDVTGDNIIPKQDPADPSSSDLTRPTNAFVTVTPGDLHDTVGALMTATKGAVKDYEDHKKDVRDKVNNLSGATYVGSGGHIYRKFHDQDLVDAQEKLLRACADAIELVGQYTAALNNAAQFYAHADKESFIHEDLDISLQRK